MGKRKRLSPVSYTHLDVYKRQVLGCIVLLFQALLLAHGGISTLGANTFSMAIIGPFVAYFVYKLCQKLNTPTWLGVFLAAALGNLLTLSLIHI